MSGVFSRRGAQPPKAPPPPPAPAAEADPSMEDILASIRRILNEGETETPEPVAQAPVEAAAPPVAAPPAPASVQAAPVADVQPPLEVAQQNASVTAPESVKPDSDVFILEPDMMVTENASAAAEADTTPIASSETMNAASQSVGALKKALSERHAQIYKATAISLEEIVREEVRPMLKDWLDSHLPAIVERLVRAEIERVVAREVM